MSDEWSIRAVICVILTSFVAAMCLFIFGGVAYEHEHTKEIYYSKSICLVLTRGYQSYPYRVRASIYTRYGPIWSVQLDKKPSINATIESYERFSSIKEAMAATCVHMVNTNISDRASNLLVCSIFTKLISERERKVIITSHVSE